MKKRTRALQTPETFGKNAMDHAYTTNDSGDFNSEDEEAMLANLRDKKKLLVEEVEFICVFRLYFGVVERS